MVNKANLLDDTEEVDVDIVEGEVHGDESGALSDPESGLQLLHYLDGVVLEVVEVLDVARAGVRCQLAPGGGPLQNVLSLVLPTEEKVEG